MHIIAQLLEDRLRRTAKLGVAIPSPRQISAPAVAVQHAHFAAELRTIVVEIVVMVVMGEPQR